jgi:aspartate aminotransferase
LITLNYLSQIIKSNDLLIINSPSNPTGRVFTQKEQFELGEILQKKLTCGYVISDEIYGKLVYEGEDYKSFSTFFDRTIVVNGISKSAASAGLRVGWIITCNKKLIQAFATANASIISCPPTANQFAAIPVVNGNTKQTIKHYNNILLQNRDIVTNELQKSGIPFVLPQGSFYIFPKIGHLINKPVFDFVCFVHNKKTVW